MAKRSQQDSGDSKIATDDESYCEDAFVRVVFNFSEQDPWKSVVGEDGLGQPGEETVSFSPTDCSKLDYDRVWSSQEWKAEATTHDQSGQSDRASWRMLQHVLITKQLFSTEVRNP